MNAFFHQMVEHPLTQRKLDVVSESYELLCQYKDQLLRADDIVSAQFYYSNPLLYLLLDGETQRHACLYDNLYLLNTSMWDEIEIEHLILAVNDLFVQHIGFENTEKLSQLVNANTLKKFHENYGLYLIGISVGESSGPCS